MKKIDILAAFFIGEICALISLPVFRFLELPNIVIKFANFFPILLPVLSVAGVWFVSFFEKKLPVIFQMGKNLLVGILNTFIDLGILNFLMWLSGIARGWQYTVFKALSFGAAVINSYLWNKYWTFEKKETKVGAGEFSKFFSIALGGLFIHISVGSLVVNIIGPQFGIPEKIWANIGAIFAVVCGFLWDFFGYKFFVFKK